MAILTTAQIQDLHSVLASRLIAACFGSGVDSTAMLIALHEANLRPGVTTFADTGGEKPETLAHLDAMNRVMAQWGWDPIAVCRKKTLAKTGYSDLYGNCLKNETLPSLAFGLKSCSLKWKVTPQDGYIKGSKRGPNARPPHPVWLESQRRGVRIVKLIGYDCGRADIRRSKNLSTHDGAFDYAYPLQILGWTRRDCVNVIEQALGAEMVPMKSACYFCPASRQWELLWLAAHHAELLERALRLERTALTGRHSRFDEIEFGASWEHIVRTSGRFPSTGTTVGLGRDFSWNQWARVHNVVDDQFRVHRTETHRERFLAMARDLCEVDNALDRRYRGIESSLVPRQLALALEPPPNFTRVILPG